MMFFIAKSIVKGKYEKAKSKYEECLFKRRKILKSRNNQILYSLNDLGNVFNNLVIISN